jgi:hypothetical protein
VIERIIDLPAGVVGMRAVGQFTVADYKQTIVPELDHRGESSEEVRLLLHLGPEFTGFGEGAWAELTSELRRMPFDRGALVTDDSQIRHGMRVLRWALRGNVRTFRNREYDDAVAWVAG